MTQSKPVKKKKKSKPEKPKNDDKKANSTRPPTAVDKRKVAAENLREMIKEAHKMHKNHTRSLKGLSAPTSKDTIGKPQEPEKPGVKPSNDGKSLTVQISKSSKTIKERMEEKASSIQMKTRQRLSQDIVKREGPSRKGSNESGKKIEVVSGRHGSADFQVKKKQEAVPRGGSAVFPAKKRSDITPRQGSAEFPVARMEGLRTRGSSRKRRESVLRIKDYQVGSFVSLELLDKMKCHESDMCVRSRKSILRPSRHDSQKSKEASVKTSDGSAKKSKKGDKRKKDDGVVSGKKISTHKPPSEKRKTKKSTTAKRGKVDSETAPVKRESRQITQTKSVISNSKSVSSNLDSNISSITGGGDLFSSNTSRSYFSSESDISKIDKKFMQILEAVTQTKIGFEERAKQMAAEQRNDADLPSTSGEESKKREPSELEQKLLDRISYLEQKLERSKASVEDTTETKKESENTEKSDVSPKDGPEELQTEKSEPRQPAVEKKAKDAVAPKVEKASKSCDGPSIREAAQLAKPPRKRQESVIETKTPNVTDTSKGREKESSRQETATKKHRREDNKPTDTKDTPTKGAATIADTEGEKSGYKRVETWSIIKRLEKAFQTLGLNLEDLDNSDEDENDTSAKKKQRQKKRESSGPEKGVLPRSETLRRCQEAAQASSSSTKKASGDIPFVAETNGSGDKNTEYKRVRSSKKTEDLIRPIRSDTKDKKSKDKEAYYASVKLTPRIKISEGGEMGCSPDEKHIKCKSSRKRSGDGEKQAAEHGIIPKKSKPTPEELRNSKRYGKRSYKINLDDGYIGHGKSKSEYSLSVSYSATSLSEDDGTKYHKRKKKNHSLVREPYTRDEEVWPKTNGKGDATSQTLKKTDPEVHSNSTENIKKTATSGVQATLSKTHKILKMEEESDELELKQIRQRHRQIISEIKLSLEEIKKQHNLCMKLRKQTKQFNRDCHAKRRMLASYLRDVEESYQRRNRRDITSKHSRALSTDSYHFNLLRNTKIRGKHSDCDMMRHHRDKYVFETDNETSTVSEVLSSIVLGHTSTELALTDSGDESYRSMTSSLRTVCRKYRQEKDTASGEGIASMEMLCLQWEGDDKQSFPHDGVETPNYLVDLLQKLNRIIVTEKNQLENLVVKASASSNRSTQSNKTSLSAKSSGSSLHREQHYKASGVNRPATTENEACSANLPLSGSSRQHKSKGSKKSGRDISPELEEGHSITRLRSVIRGDPGGRSYDNLHEQERGLVIADPYPVTRTDTISQCGTSCIHLEKHAEEHRYRKGDPSFRSQSHILQQLGEHSRHCTEKVEEDDDAWKRKIELERILRVNEKMFRRTTSFGRDADTHALDYDPYITAKGRYGKHRQQSIIIDHNRGEENEESETVLGHASRHSGVAFGHHRKHDRKAPHEYLKADRKSGSSHLGRHQESWKKGKRHHVEEVPINFCEISVNTPGSSSIRLRDVHCQTDNVDDYDDIGDMYLLEESGSSPSLN